MKEIRKFFSVKRLLADRTKFTDFFLLTYSLATKEAKKLKYVFEPI